MIHRITINELLERTDRIPLLDVRTALEFDQGHIPGAINLPLFSNAERVQVGTTYKQEGREAAILLGFDLTGNKWSGFIRQALDIAPQMKIALHCWRGGMRSGAMAWAFDLYGFEVFLVEGGYKSYRRSLFRQFSRPCRLLVIGGMTGSGKTRILHALRSIGEQVIDLEALARHQGSSYGTLNRLIQPSQEQFENDLAEQLRAFDSQRSVWIEDESKTIGKCLIPKLLWDRMATAFLYDLQVPVDQRVSGLVEEYGSLDQEFLVESTDRIRKRLGLEQAKNAIIAIREGRMDEFIRLVLVYYDKAYRIGLSSRDTTHIFPIPIHGADPFLNAKQILALAQAIPENPINSTLAINPIA
jgi:tRNA 2-selenouridine synthase